MGLSVIKDITLVTNPAMAFCKHNYPYSFHGLMVEDDGRRKIVFALEMSKRAKKYSISN